MKEKKYLWNDDYSSKCILPYILKYLKKKWKILDLGCGNGRISNILINKGYDVYGIDASSEGIEIANKYNKGRFFVCDINSFKLPKELRNIDFDAIISTEVIEHVYSTKIFFSVCSEILKNNGFLIISTPYHGYIKNLLISLFNKWDFHLDPSWEGGHIKFWSKNSLYKSLKKNGFFPKKFIGVKRFPFIWRNMVVISKSENKHNNCLQKQR